MSCTEKAVEVSVVSVILEVLVPFKTAGTVDKMKILFLKDPCQIVWSGGFKLHC